MAPPNSPPGPNSSHHGHSKSHSYGAPPPRPPSLGPPSSFASGRDLPALSSLTRASSGGSSMSISSMLGGPSPASREPPAPPRHYSPHSAPPGPTPGPPYNSSSVQASPRMHSASSEFPPFRRPQTPEHSRPYDHRGSAGPSPRGPYASTPEMQRYGTPGSYHARHPSAPPDPRDGRTSTGPPLTPGSQSKTPYGGLPRPGEMSRPPPEDAYGRRDDAGRDYAMDRSAPPQHYPFDNRYRLDRDRPPSVEHRDRDNDRQYAPNEPPRHLDTGLRDPPRNSPYGGRPNEPWGRQSGEYRAPMEHSRPPPHEYPPASNPYPHSSYQTAPADRYPSGGYGGPPQYDTQDRAQFERLHPGPPPPRPRMGEDPQPAPTSAGYPTSAPYDPTRQRQDDPGAPHQRNIAAVQDMNRKGRMSPLPQAVQGAQSQQPGPATEPGIKSEFGRMFAGIGSGVGPSSPVATSAHPYTGAGAKDLDDKGRRRKKEEEGRDDDSSGRVTPLDGRGAKRSKAHHHHQYVLERTLT